MNAVIKREGMRELTSAGWPRLSGIDASRVDSEQGPAFSASMSPRYLKFIDLIFYTAIWAADD